MQIKIIDQNSWIHVWEINGKKIELSTRMSEYNSVDKIYSLVSQIQELIIRGIPINNLFIGLSHPFFYIDFIRILISSFPEEKLKLYINHMLKRIYDKNEKPILRQDSLYRIVFKEICGENFNFHNANQLYKNSIDFVKFLKLIKNQYDKFIESCVKEYVLNNKPLSTLPNSIATPTFKLDLLCKLDYENLVNYIKNIVSNIIKNFEKPIIDHMELIRIIYKEIIDLDYYEGGRSSNKQKVLDIIEYEYCVQIINRDILEKKPISQLPNNILTSSEKFLIIFSNKMNIIEDYIRFHFESYYKRRELVRFLQFSREILGIGSISNITFGKNKSDIIDNYNYLKHILDNYFEEYGEKLIETNKDQIKLNNDIWKLFYKDGLNYTYKEFDFSKILSKEFKYEIKLFVRDELTYRPIRNINTLDLIIPCVNYVYEKNSAANCIANISEHDIRKLYSYLTKEYITKQKNKLRPSSVQKMIKRLGAVNEFLIKFLMKNELGTIKPKINMFDNIVFNNIENMHEKTQPIPEIVIEQLENYIDELSPSYSLIYSIFINTGLRIKDLLLLEADCLIDTEWEHLKILKYKAHKVSNIAKKHSRLEKNEIIIPQEVALKIRNQINSTELLRQKNSTNNIFIHLLSETGKVRASLISGQGFLKAINKLVTKYNIVDYDNKLWHFTSRQFRKTIVVTMIENGATKAEVAYVLGHYNLITMEKYYAEVRDKRLAEMNSEFWKNKFKITIGEDNLEKFTESERKLLYVDFISNYRRVEFGYCSKHYSEGICGNNTGRTSCAACNKLCTGKQFIDEWLDIMKSQKNTVEHLEKFYLKNKIPYEKYYEFIEYKKEIYFLAIFKDMVEKIQSS